MMMWAPGAPQTSSHPSGEKAWWNTQGVEKAWWNTQGIL